MLTTGVELAHDLRMPLQLICSSARMLALSVDDPALDARAYADVLMDSVNRLLETLNGALDGAQAPGGPRRMDLAACVRALCRSCRPYADEKGIALRYNGNVAALDALADEDMLSRVLLNLISNALRFTPAGGWIRVRLRARGDYVEISVSDSGAGIPAERQPYVFLRGETEGGHGCGLPIARELARQMGGELSLRSAPGSGATFTLRLPVGSVRAG